MSTRIRCPSCRALSDPEGHPPGGFFACACGNKLPVPTGMRRKTFAWAWLPYILLLLATVIAIPQLLSYDRTPFVDAPDHEAWEAKTADARAALLDLCDREGAWHAKTKEWVPIAPVPASIPASPVAATSESFTKVGFAPKPLPFQFAVLERGDAVLCIARGNLDAGGIPWTLSARNSGSGSYAMESADAPPVPNYDD